MQISLSPIAKQVLLKSILFVIVIAIIAVLQSRATAPVSVV